MFKLLTIIAVVATCCFAAPNSIRDGKSCIGKCPAKDTPDQIVLLASSRCPLYCKCEAGSPVPYDCRNGWYFSKKEGTCVPLGESKCPTNQ